MIQVGDEEHRIGPGETAFGPRGVPHAQRRVVPGEGRILIAVTPGGFEGFFRALAEADRRASSAPRPMRRPLRSSGSPGSDGGAQRFFLCFLHF